MTMYDNISFTASLIGHPTRMTILVTLADGRAFPASDLASMAGVSPQTASAHLEKLVEGSLITVEKSGKHRYYQLAGPKVADAIESIAQVSPPIQVRSLRESGYKKALYAGRTCYGHLAGTLGVKLTESMVDLGYFEYMGEFYRLTGKGEQWLRGFKIMPSRKVNKQAIPYHIDWTERRHHIAGPLALAITHRLFELGWIQKGNVHRSVKTTDKGNTEIKEAFGFDPGLLQ